MRKPVFSIEEAGRLAWGTSRDLLKLELHQWAQAKEIIRLKRGLYAFPQGVTDKTEIARALYSPAYLSLEYALNFYGLLPEAVFAMTLVTPKATRRFTTPFGDFIYHKIKQNLFWGYDPHTLIGEREKVLVDYCYLYRNRLLPIPDFWETVRLQNLREVSFKKAKAYARRTDSKKVMDLIDSLEAFRRSYGKS